MSTYGLFQTPILTTHGMITGVTIDGYYAYQPAPVIKMSDFFRPKYDTPKEKYLPYDVYDKMKSEQEMERKRVEETLKPKTQNEIDILKLKVANEEQQKKYAMTQLEDEKKKNQELQKKIDEEQTKRIEEEKEKTKLTTQKLDEFNRMMRNIAFKNFKTNDAASTVSSFDIPSSVGSTIPSKKIFRRGGRNQKNKTDTRDTASSVSTTSTTSKTNSTVSYPDSVISSVTNLDSISEIDIDDSASNISAESTNSNETITEEEESFNRLNKESRYAMCTNCNSCYGGVISVGTVFVNNTGDDTLFILGFNKSENAFCDFGQKLKSNGRKMEYPSERAEKTLKKLTKFEYELYGNEFIDIPIRNSDHVHRVYIIQYDNTCMPQLEKTNEINNYETFSLNKMDVNYNEFKNKKIYNINNKKFVINKRIQKFFDIFYNKKFN